MDVVGCCAGPHPLALARLALAQYIRRLSLRQGARMGEAALPLASEVRVCGSLHNYVLLEAMAWPTLARWEKKNGFDLKA
jgi:hypothetical protein